MTEIIVSKIKRIYSAVGEMNEKDLNTLTPIPVKEGDFKGVKFNVRNDLTDEQLTNYCYSAIHNVSNLKDNITKWAKNNGKDSQKILDEFNKSQELKVLSDLSNQDKHGGDDRDGGFSKLYPKLNNVRRLLQISSTDPNTPAQIGPLLDGKINIVGNNTKLVITGDIFDSNGQLVGDLNDYLGKALVIWESILKSYGLKF